MAELAIKRFQFHTGLIKIEINQKFAAVLLGFQFHTGLIKIKAGENT